MARDFNILLVSGDGVLKFSHLIASGLATFQLVTSEKNVANFDFRYMVSLTQKGKQIVDAWFSGNRQMVEEALNALPSN
jgi:hypothetical protein